ncbi:MAG: hypothetical protein GF375_05770 [Candidatus Omnitrophica bacterium]|nr:hypothetical protein [Candidatus Omnitrophota bacterium]MBD3269482.1 hypothetical protein [Candidatus Omnitrophota bacterium]
MTRKDIIQQLKDNFAADIINIFDKSQTRLYLDIKAGSLKKIAEYIFKAQKARFNIATGSDLRFHMEILYHFTVEDINLLISLRVKLKKPDLEVDSLAPLFEGANWIEREMNELLGIKFRGHPDLRRLLLSDDWPEDVYPLRCDYKEWDEKAIRDRGV